MRYVFKIIPELDLERLICCTALNSNLHHYRSAHRFEQDSYHGGALPTELTSAVLLYGLTLTSLGEASVLPAR